MVVSDTDRYPNVSDPTTYSFSRTAVTLANGVVDLTIALTNYSRPAGSLHVGSYYVAVSSTANVTCQYELLVYTVGQRRMRAGGNVLETAYQDTASYFTFAPMPYNTSASFAVRLNPNSGQLLMYVGVDESPTVVDPSTYLLSTAYNTTQTQKIDSQRFYIAQSIYIPASACSSPTLAGQSCAVVFMAASSEWGQDVFIRSMSSAAAVWLLENQPAPVNTSSLTSTYQFSLPASPLSVTLSINTSWPLSVWCSYQYVTPDSTFYDWRWQVDADRSTADSPNNTTQLNFTWADTATAATPLQQTNPNTQLAALPTTCYCTVQTSSFDSYTLVYSTTPLSSHADSHSGLSGGALAAAVVVPVVAVLLLAGLMVVWVRRGGGVVCCRFDGTSKRSPTGSTARQQRQGGTDDREMSMAELSSSSRPSDGRLMSQQWRSDRV